MSHDHNPQLTMTHRGRFDDTCGEEKKQLILLKTTSVKNRKSLNGRFQGTMHAYTRLSYASIFSHRMTERSCLARQKPDRHENYRTETER